MSVPAINTLPSSGNQSSKLNTNSTSSSTPVPSIGVSVNPKIAVIPPTPIHTSPNKSPINVNHSSVALSLIYENKVVSTQGQSSITKSPTEKTNESPVVKPTSNGVDDLKLLTLNEETQSSSVPSSKTEEDSNPQNVLNHVDDRISLTSCELSVDNDELSQTSFSQLETLTAEKVEQSLSQIFSKDDDYSESNSNLETQRSTEESVNDVTSENAETVSDVSSATKRKREQTTPEKKSNEPEPEPEKKTRRIRSQVLPYQSPLPEIATFINKSLKEKDSAPKSSEEKLIVFYRYEFYTLFFIVLLQQSVRIDFLL